MNNRSRKINISAAIKPAVYAEIERLAARDGRSLSNMVSVLLDRAVAEYDDRTVDTKSVGKKEEHKLKMDGRSSS